MSVALTTVGLHFSGGGGFDLDDVIVPRAGSKNDARWLSKDACQTFHRDTPAAPRTMDGASCAIFDRLQLVDSRDALWMIYWNFSMKTRKNYYRHHHRNQLLQDQALSMIYRW
jgi:hypothetical protein